jgi:hypothetical protein
LDYLPNTSNILGLVKNPNQFVSSFLNLGHYFQIDYYLEILSKILIEEQLIPLYLEIGFHHHLIDFLEKFPSSTSSISNILYILLSIEKGIDNNESGRNDNQKIIDLLIPRFSRGEITDQISVVKLLAELTIDLNQNLSKYILDCLNHCSQSLWPYLQIFVENLSKSQTFLHF